MTRLDEVCDIIMGQAPPGESYNSEDNGIPLIAGAGDFGEIYPKVHKFTTHAIRVTRGGDIVVGIRATIGEKVLADGEYCLGRGVAALQPRPSLDSRYLWHWLEEARPRLASKATGATFKQVGRESIGSLHIDLPPLEEQRRIAAILDKAEALRAKRRAALARLDQLTQSIFLDMFGDPVTNPKGWPVHILGDLMREGPQNGLYRPLSDYGSGVPILRIDSFYNGEVLNPNALRRVRVPLSERDRYSLHEDDIVMNRVNSMEYLGKSALITRLDEPTIFESNMMRFQVLKRRILPKFVIHLLQTSFIGDQIKQSAKHAVNQSSINQRDVQGFRVYVPPYSLQSEFGERIRAAQQIKAAHRSSLTLVERLFASLQQRAFRGELSRGGGSGDSGELIAAS